MTPAEKASILIVDDEGAVRDVLARIFQRAGYGKVATASTAEEARSLLDENDIDVVLSDMQMPGESGLDLLTEVHERMTDVATLMVTGMDDASLGEKALEIGVYGYIIKPFKKNEVLVGVSNALRRRDLESAHRDRLDSLEVTVRERTSDLLQAIRRLELAERDLTVSRSETIQRLAIAAEFRDEETSRHVVRMSRYCKLLASRTGLDQELLRSIEDASSLHDVGKIGVPDGILLKPGPLSPEEREVMQRHAEIGHRILSGTSSPLLDLAATIALTHHEKVDGTGYPQRLSHDEIPVVGRIAAIADVFDALTTNRVYRKAYPVGIAIQMMKADTGSHFDPDLLDVFWSVLPEVLDVRAELGIEGSSVRQEKRSKLLTREGVR